jgi:hypothetical protein
MFVDKCESFLLFFGSLFVKHTSKAMEESAVDCCVEWLGHRRYNQVSRILSPIALCVEKVEEICKDPGVCGECNSNRRVASCFLSKHFFRVSCVAFLAEYIDSTFGGPEKARMDILADFFRGGFDGSGADNFFGACVPPRYYCNIIEAPWLVNGGHGASFCATYAETER